MIVGKIFLETGISSCFKPRILAAKKRYEAKVVMIRKQKKLLHPGMQVDLSTITTLQAQLVACQRENRGPAAWRQG